MTTSPGRTAVRRIISGGQTGVDRGALDAAIALGIAHGGWCPRGRLSENGPIPAAYELTETDAPVYAVRTEKNVLDSDATLILCRGPLRGGTELTRLFAERHGKPCLVVDVNHQAECDAVAAWLVQHRVERLNVAGPRESTSPGIAADAEQFIRQLFSGSDH